jgi:hypothetical protein
MAETAFAEAIRRIRESAPGVYDKYTDVELAEALRKKYPEHAAVLTPPVQPRTYIGGIQEPEWLTQAGKTFAGYVPKAPAGMAAPPAAGVLGRAAIQGATAAGEGLFKGKTSLGQIAGEAGKGAAFSLGAEGLMKGVVGPLARVIGMQGAGKSAQAAYEAATKTAAGKEAHDVAMTQALNAAEKKAFEQAAAQHAERGAAEIADDLFKNVPALRGTEASGRGLYDAIYGTGKQKVSEAFDEALRLVMKRGAGQQVQLPSEIAERLGFNVAASPLAGMSPAVVEALRKAGRLPQGLEAGRVSVDAAALAERVTGLWKKDPKAYRAVVNALDDAGIGDPAARAAYKTWAGTADFIDKAKALTAEGVLDPKKLLKAFADLKSVEILRRRGLGSGTEGVIQQAARGGPLAPTPRQAPVQPPAPDAPDIRVQHIPEWYRHMIGSGVGGAVGGLAGGFPGSLLGVLGGFAGGRMIPKDFITRGPVPSGIEPAVRAATGPLAAGTRGVWDYITGSTAE